MKARMGPEAAERLEQFQGLSLDDKLDLLFLGALESAVNTQWMMNKFNQ